MAKIDFDDAVAALAAFIMDERRMSSAVTATNEARRVLWPLLSVGDASAMVMR
jgi:hypothetical protein